MRDVIVELMVSPLSITITKGHIENIKCGDVHVKYIKRDGMSITQYANYDEMDETTRNECFNFIRYTANEIHQNGELKVFSI